MEKHRKLSDQQLVGMYREGDNEAFDALLERHQQRLFRYILTLTHGDEDLANDHFQDTFVKAICAIRDGRYQENGQFAAWLLRIARNIAIDNARGLSTQRRVGNTGSDQQTDILGQQADPTPDAETLLAQEQTLADVRLMVSHLPESQREVVELRYFHELSFREIADLTGVSINTALGRMRYALLNLRRMSEGKSLYAAS